jgi:hypothetical protein
VKLLRVVGDGLKKTLIDFKDYCYTLMLDHNIFIYIIYNIYLQSPPGSHIRSSIFDSVNKLFEAGYFYF